MRYRDKLADLLPTSVNIINWTAEIQLNNLEMVYRLPSLPRIPFNAFGEDVGIDSEAIIMASMSERHRKYNPLSGHALKLSVYEKRGADASDFMPGKNIANKYLYNLGVEGYYNLLNPFLASAQFIVQDLDVIWQFQISDKPQDFDPSESYVRIRGDFSATINYEWEHKKVQIEERTTTHDVGTQSIALANPDPNRIGIFISNLSLSDALYFRFTYSSLAFPADAGILLPAGNSFFYFNEEVAGISPTEAQKLPPSLVIGLKGVRKSGLGKVVVQEFYTT